MSKAAMIVVVLCFRLHSGPVTVARPIRCRGAGRVILGTTVIGGMLAATVIAIYLIPVSFYVVERLRRERRVEAAPPVSPLVPSRIPRGEH